LYNFIIRNKTRLKRTRGLRGEFPALSPPESIYDGIHENDFGIRRAVQIHKANQETMGRIRMNEFDEQRKQMVAYQLRARGINDQRVLEAFETIPRHLFVPDEALEWAYEDRPLLIGFGQTISQPYIVAYMIQALELIGKERVLEVGTGSGYQAAILSRLAQEVYTVELIEPLAKQAAQALAVVGVTNVFTHTGDGSRGWIEAAPYDSIIVSAAARLVPGSLLEQLANHGRMILPVSAGKYQKLELWTCEGNSFTHETLLSVAFVPLSGREGL
jgi:protein-L-isoaspartate(D-aspartate) O-methyltransferase